MLWMKSASTAVKFWTMLSTLRRILETVISTLDTFSPSVVPMMFRRRLRAAFVTPLNRINLPSGRASGGGVSAPATGTGICTPASGFGQVTDTIGDFNGAPAIGPGEARNIQLVAKMIF